MINPDQLLLASLIKQESGGNPMAVSPKGAAGIMQIMPETARDPGYGVTPLQGWDGKDPRTAPVQEQIRFGRDYLEAMKRVNGGDTNLALASYNAGPGAVQQYGGIPPFKETQDYVRNINSNMGTQMASNDWRSRAQPIMSDAQPASDWRSRAQPDWRARAEPAQIGEDMGGGAARVQGFNSAIPFGERIAAGLAAGGTKLYDKTIGNNVTEGQSVSDLYREVRANQKATEAANPGEYLTGALLGTAATLPAASAKVITGARATTGARGAVNAIPEMLQGVGTWVRGSKAASNAGTIAKAANLGGKAVRSAAVAAPTGALYSYGASDSDIDTKEALGDAASGARLGAAVGGALPVVGAALNKTLVPAVSDATKALANRAKDFGLDLSLDQIAPTRVRSTLQKVSQNLPLSGVDDFQNSQRATWNKALAAQLGEDADNLGPEVIQNFLSKANKSFEGVLNGKTVVFNKSDLKKLDSIISEADNSYTKDIADVVFKNAKAVAGDLKSSGFSSSYIDGQKLSSLRGTLIKRMPNLPPGAKQSVAELIDVMDDVAERKLNADEVSALKAARKQWRNYRTVEPLLEKSPDGMINPAQLMQRVASSKFIKASRAKVGEDELVDLARIGKQFLTSKEGSDTAQKTLVQRGFIGNAALLAGAPELAIPALLAQGGAVAVNRGYQSLINRSPALVNRAINGGALNPKTLPIADMLAAGATQRVTGK